MPGPTLDDYTDALAAVATDLKLSRPRAAAILQLQRECLDCVLTTSAGRTDRTWLKAQIVAIEAGRATACPCRPYSATAARLTICREWQNQTGAVADPPCGYGWLVTDAAGQPVFSDLPEPTAPTTSFGACVAAGGFWDAASQRCYSTPADQRTPPPARRPTRSAWPTLAAFGMLFAGAWLVADARAKASGR